jgi:malonate transporter and related proteins
MLHIPLVILPVFLLIFLGYLCRRFSFPGEGFWAPAEKLTYYFLLPALLTIILAEAEFVTTDLFPLMITVLGAVCAVATLCFLLRPFLGIDGPAFTSFFQAVVRLNSYTGLSIAYGLYGDSGLALVAVVACVLVPFGNVSSVIVLARHGTRARPTVRDILFQVVTNPLILGCVLGGLLNVTGIGSPPVIGDVLKILSRAALPLGLLAVGAALDLRGAWSARRSALTACAVKLVLLPLATFLTALWLGLSGPALVIAVLINGLPTASSSYILARLMGGDAPFMANLFGAQTLFSMASLPLALTLLHFL